MGQRKTRMIALIDFSVYSHVLIELGSRWCSLSGAELLLLHKVTALVPGMADSESRAWIVDSEKEEALERLKKISEGKISSSTTVKYHVTHKNLLDELDGLFKEGFEDYILLGIKGTGMLKTKIIGSTAAEILNEINHLTVAVPAKLCSAPNKLCTLVPKNIVVALSDKYPLNETVFNNFLDTFRESVQQVRFISVIPPNEKEEKNEEFLTGLRNRYNERIPASWKVFKGNSVFDEIKSNVHTDSDTVLVVQKGSRSLTDIIFRKFLINQLVNDGSIPLIILPL